MPDPHCSKCCPTKPPTPAEPWAPAPGVYLWIIVLAAGILGTWWATVWSANRLLG